MEDRYLFKAKHIHILPGNDHLDGSWVVGFLSGERYIAKEYHFEKLVDDYCELYDIKAGLIKDVKENGVTITELNVKGYEVHKANPAISEISKISGAMLKILSQLNISAEDNISEF